MKLKCVVIDDDKYAVNALVNYIDKLPDLIVHQIFTKSTLALAEIKASDKIDIIFLDIEMPNLSGLDLAKNLRDKTKFLVFTTSHDHHALAAFGLNVNQYLLKPITFAKFALAVDFLMKSIGNASILQPDQTSTHLQKNKLQFIKADQRYTYHYINPAEITHIQASGNEVVIFTPEEKYVTQMGLNHVEIALAKDEFIRIAKSYIIAKSAIKKVEGHNIRLKNNLVFPLGKVYRNAFIEFMKSEMMKPGSDGDFQLGNEK